jgi:hypothetical protein
MHSWRVRVLHRSGDDAALVVESVRVTRSVSAAGGYLYAVLQPECVVLSGDRGLRTVGICGQYEDLAALHERFDGIEQSIRAALREGSERA